MNKNLDWKAACDQAEQLMDDSQFQLYVGEVFNTEPLFEFAKSLLNVDDSFNPVLAAALVLKLAERLNLGSNLPTSAEVATKQEEKDAIDYAETYADSYNTSPPDRVDVVNAVYWGMRFKRPKQTNPVCRICGAALGEVHTAAGNLGCGWPFRVQATDCEVTPPSAESFQTRVLPWMLTCFGQEVASDKVERHHRFLEEALELVQSTGCTKSEAHQLVDYVFGRPVGEPVQEVGGVMVTLAALCLSHGMDMHLAGETELARIWTKIEQIRSKQAGKPKHSPLPSAEQKKTQLKKGECWPEDVMILWDYWRSEIASGHKGSAPRDWFESLAEMRLVADKTQPETYVIGIRDHLFIESRGDGTWLVCVEKVHDSESSAKNACDHWKARLEVTAQSIVDLTKLSVTNIMIDVVPGDGSGVEIYAKSVTEVNALLSKLGAEVEDSLGAPRVAIPPGLEQALIAECERAMAQRDKFLQTRVSTASHEGSHDTCFGAVLRKYLTKE